MGPGACALDTRIAILGLLAYIWGLRQRLRCIQVGAALHGELRGSRAIIKTKIVGLKTKTIGDNGLASLFATRTTAALLAAFSLHPDRVFYQKELVDFTGSSLYLVQRELKRLERTGLVVRIPRGRQVEYAVRREHPAFSGLSDALLRTVALGDRLRALFAGLEDIDLVFVFGSVAGGKASASSDLDVMVVGDIGLRAVAERVVPLTRELAREPNLVVMDLETFRARARSGDGFVASVIGGPKIWVIGDEEKLAGVGPACASPQRVK